LLFIPDELPLELPEDESLLELSHPIDRPPTTSAVAKSKLY